MICIKDANLLQTRRVGLVRTDFMNIPTAATALTDNGGRRSSFDRRQFLYTTHVPERRIDGERRRERDRRNLTDRRYLSDRRTLSEALCCLENMIGLECRRKKQERRGREERRAAFAPVLAPA
jgi:hypothetical protein